MSFITLSRRQAKYKQNQTLHKDTTRQYICKQENKNLPRVQNSSEHSQHWSVWNYPSQELIKVLKLQQSPQHSEIFDEHPEPRMTRLV